VCRPRTAKRSSIPCYPGRLPRGQPRAKLAATTVPANTGYRLSIRSAPPVRSDGLAMRGVLIPGIRKRRLARRAPGLGQCVAVTVDFPIYSPQGGDASTDGSVNDQITGILQMRPDPVSPILRSGYWQEGRGGPRILRRHRCESPGRWPLQGRGTQVQIRIAPEQCCPK
jgi:hypothetical protein